MRAAGSDDPVSLDALGCSVCSLQRDEHPVTVVVHRDNLGAAVHDDAVLGEPAGQDLLGPPLRQAALELPPAARARERHLGHAPEVRVEDAREAEVLGCLEYPVGDPGLLQNLERGWLQRGCPGLVVRLRRPFDHACTHPMTGELDGREQARRPGAYHQNLCPRLPRCPRITHQPQ